MLYYYKFVKWDAIPIEDAMQHSTIKRFVEYDKGNKNALKGLDVVLDDPIIKVGGWAFGVRPYLKKYWVKLEHYGIQEYYAINKTAIRKKLGSHVVKIIEVKGD